MYAASVSFLVFESYGALLALHSFPTRRSSDLATSSTSSGGTPATSSIASGLAATRSRTWRARTASSQPATWRTCRSGSEIGRSEEHTSELQSQSNLVCRLLLEKKKRDDSFSTF